MSVTFCVGNINPGNVSAQFMHSMFGLMQEPVTDLARFTKYLTKTPAGPYLDCERNLVVQQFLATDADVLVFLDADMDFTVEAVHRLAAQVSEDLPVVGGLYANWWPEHGYRAVAFDWHDDLALGGRTITPIPIPAPGTDHPIQVDVVGTGLMAIHRSVFYALSEKFEPPTPWFAEVAMHGAQMGEDVTFCARVASLGFPILLDPTITAGHYKTVRLHPDTIPSTKPAQPQKEEIPCPVP